MDINSILSLLFMVFWLFIIFYGQKLQVSSLMKRIEFEILKLKERRNIFKTEGYKLFMTGTEKDFVTKKVLDDAIEHFTIMPTTLDPNKIIPKMKHLLTMRDEYYETLVHNLFPNKPKQERRNLESIIQVMAEVEMLYKIARHYYFLAKKSGNDIIWAMQANMIVAQIKPLFTVFKNAMLSFSSGIPIGDGAGPMVVEKLGRGCEWKSIEFDTVMTETTIENHKVYIIKAEGAGSTVGRVNEALKKMIDKIDVVIMIDAALKAEGDISGEVITAEGAAIGGLGVEKFEIEEMVTKREIPLYAFLIKESLAEALGPMTKEISHASNYVAILKIKDLIKSLDEDAVIVIIGVGNTVGVGQ